MLRIITGTAKGKKLKTLEGDATRPTSERIKEAIFSALQFDLEDRRILDLFAGSGQMGLEALSRGSASVMFIDSAREAMDIVKENARAVGFFDKCRYLVSDYRNYIRKASGRERFDLVFIDPPYAMECCADAAKRLSESGMLADGAIVVLESGEEEIDLASLSSFEVIKSTRYGKKSAVNILLYRENLK
ncbi:MAG: 16S rRNA (guanine(966)-N(2))-methyltransferase RsmD [Clostridia bacterium]|nr:16S rRNA (guanine(966)-N(2))-methyltransferase RsmD [Clostridia bacterium]